MKILGTPPGSSEHTVDKTRVKKLKKRNENSK